MLLQFTKNRKFFKKNLLQIKNKLKRSPGYITGSFIETCKDFFRRTQLHGFTYIFDKIDDTGNLYLNGLLRFIGFLIWIMSVTTGMLFGIYLMLRVWNKYQNTPTITTIETNSYPVWNVDFPAVTICNVNSVYKPSAKSLSEKLLENDFSPKEIASFYQSLSALISFDEVDSSHLKILNSLRSMNYKISSIMFLLTHPCEKMLRQCFWRGSHISCGTLFRTTKSAEGFCCSFNYVAYRSYLELVEVAYIPSSILETCKDFCKHTQLHGFRLIFEDIDDPGNSYLRGLLRFISLAIWLISITIGMLFGIYLIMLIWNRYQNTPTITTIETNNYPTWNVQFPGITICNINTVYKPNTFNISKQLLREGFSLSEINSFFQSLSKLVSFDEVDYNHLRIVDTLKDMNYSVGKLMFSLSQPCEKMLKQCSWVGTDTPCGSLFRLAKSAQGYCCSFNYKALRSSLEIRFLKYINLILWLTAVLMGTIFGIYLMSLVWQRYKRKATITTIETYNYPIWNLAFPAVTICNVNAVYKPNIVNLRKKLILIRRNNNGFSDDVITQFFKSLAVLINFRMIDDRFLNLSKALDNMNYTLAKLMIEVAHPCNQMLRYCSLLGKNIPCKDIFMLSKSGSGFCCSFNHKELVNNFFSESKINDSNQINTPVVRVSGAGEDVGLRVFLDVEEENYVSAKRMLYGAEIIIHDPEDFPERSLIAAFGQPGSEVSIAVTPSVVVTEPSVQNLPVNLRFCRFSNEKALRITKKYSFQSCLTECRAETVVEKCGCLPFFYPDLYNGSVTARYPQCGLVDVKCLTENKHVLASLEPPPEMHDYFNSSNIGMKCDCLPSCTEQVYSVETFTSKRFQLLNQSVGYREILNTSTDISNFTLVKVYFKDLSCIKYRREIFMSWDDMLASFGGIFGLCLGGSVLSLVEIVYYLTFKLYAKMLNNKHKTQKKKKQIKTVSKQIVFNFGKKKFSPSLKKRKITPKDFVW